MKNVENIRFWSWRYLLKDNTFMNLGLWYVLITSKTGKYLCFFVLMYVDVLFIFCLKILNVYYFNYVECKFDNSLHLFLYFKPCCFCRSMSSQYDLPYHSIILVMYSQCVWFTDISGIAKMKQTNKKTFKPNSS